MAASAPPLVAVRALSAHHRTHRGNINSSRLFISSSEPLTALLSSPPLRSSVLAFARRRKSSSPLPKTEPSDQRAKVQNDGEGDEIDEDAFEAVFSQLEEDLKSGNLSDDNANDEITEEDLLRLEQELEDALDDGHHDESSEVSPLSSEDEVDEVEKMPKLKNWQNRRLARALKIGRRKTSIKNLAAELGLDRALVLQMLRDPPPNLLLLSASLPDEVTQIPPEPKSEIVESPPTTDSDVGEGKPEVGVPVHVMRTRWSMQKRLKKVQVETLEKVYCRTKRPTNAMISSIVHVTNLPTKKVVKWFEDKRLQDGVPKHRSPFRRAVPYYKQEVEML